MTDADRLSADLMEWQLDTIVREEPYLDYMFPLEQMNGVNVRLIETHTVRHPLLTEKDAENYIAALGQVAGRMQEAPRSPSAWRPKASFHHDQPGATIAQMTNFADPLPGQNPFVTVFADKMAAVKSMSDTRRAALRAQAEKIVEAQVYPAWKKATAILQEQLPSATDDAGLWRLKGGDEAYAYFLRRYTTTNLTAERIHEIGLQQVARIEQEMDTLLRRLGRTDGSVKDRIAKLNLDMRYPNPTSEQSRAQIMVDIDGIIRDAEQRAALLFDVRPKSPVVAQAFPTFREGNAAANYNSPAPDGSRPGTFQYPRRVERMTKFGLRSVVYHDRRGIIRSRCRSKRICRARQIGAFGGISAPGMGLCRTTGRGVRLVWDDIEGRPGQPTSSVPRGAWLWIPGCTPSEDPPSIDYGIRRAKSNGLRPRLACRT
jgi:uncharacterized protein (DUF885 family)